KIACGGSAGSSVRAAPAPDLCPAPAEAASESSAAEASWGGVNDDHLVVPDLRHGERAFVRAVAVQPEGAAGSGKAGVLGQRGGSQGVRPPLRGERPDRGDAV